jgi:hypothetical protein
LRGLVRPALFAALEEGEHEFVLRGEVAIEGGLGDVGFLDHFVDADRADAAFGEQVVGDVEDAHPDLGFRSR